MDERERQRIDTLRAEAIALFEANQAGRSAAERVGALVLTVVGLTVAAGVSADSTAVALALPPIVLLLVAYMFQLKFPRVSNLSYNTPRIGSSS